MSADLWVTEASLDSRIAFSMPSGKRVWVDKFSYSRTYSGLLEGLPNRAINQRVIEEHIRSEQRFTDDPPPLLLQPEIRDGDRGGVWLPPICCRAVLDSLARAFLVFTRTMNLSAPDVALIDRALRRSSPLKCFSSAELLASRMVSALDIGVVLSVSDGSCTAVPKACRDLIVSPRTISEIPIVELTRGSGGKGRAGSGPEPT